MARWAEFEAQQPAMAAQGHELIYQFGPALGYLATVGADGYPRVHPVSPVVYDGGLYTYIIPSTPKLRDLERDGRFALHTPGPKNSDDEFFVTGRASRFEDQALSQRVYEARRQSGAMANVDAATPLFELDIERVLLATYKPRGEPENWPPRYDKWHDASPEDRHESWGRPQPPAHTDALRWHEFAALEPEMAAAGRNLIRQFGIGLGYLATVRRDGGPRLHPFCPTFSGDGLYGLILPTSPKCRDLFRNPRMAIHAFQGPERDDEFCIGGIAVPINDRAMEDQVRASAMADGMTSSGDEQLFEFLVNRAMLAAYKPRGEPGAWPPLYATWRADRATPPRR